MMGEEIKEPAASEEVQQPAPEEKKSNRKLWITLGVVGILLMVICLVVAGVILWPRLFGGADPIANQVPAEAEIYVSFDLLKLQSEEVSQLIELFQDLSGSDEDFQELLDEGLDDFNMSLEEDIVPWIGQYAAFAVTDVDIEDGDADFVFVVEARNTGKADDFLEKLSEELEDEADYKFDIDEAGGVTYYIGEDDWGEEMVIARAGKLIYFGTSQRTIEDFIEVKAKDSLAKNKHYNNVMDELPSNRLAGLYISGEFLTRYYEELFAMADIIDFDTSQYLEGLEDAALAGVGFSVSVPGDGLRMDYNVAYDKAELSEYAEKSLDVKFKDPTAAGMVSEDVFFFMGQNSSRKEPLTLEDSPFYNSDVEESLELLEDEFGISIPDLVELATGEYGLAVGPSRDSFISELGEVDLGLVLIMGVNDEDDAINLVEDLQDLLVAELFWDAEIDEDDIDIGDYEMVEIIVDDGYDKTPLITYGAQDGYFIAGVGNDLLEDGLESKDTLAKSDAYVDTWKAFPKGSVPTLYLNVAGLIEMLEDVDPDIMDDAPDFDAFRTIAVAIRQPTKTSVSGTFYLLIDF